MIGDFLKKFRNADYSGKKGDEASEPEGQEENADEKPRIIALTSDEMQAFQGSQAGADLVCEVHGSMEDGKFHVMSVAPMNKEPGYGSEQEMAGQIAQRVQPNIAPSPS